MIERQPLRTKFELHVFAEHHAGWGVEFLCRALGLQGLDKYYGDEGMRSRRDLDDPNPELRRAHIIFDCSPESEGERFAMFEGDHHFRGVTLLMAKFSDSRGRKDSQLELTFCGAANIQGQIMQLEKKYSCYVKEEPVLWSAAEVHAAYEGRLVEEWLKDTGELGDREESGYQVHTYIMNNPDAEREMRSPLGRQERQSPSVPRELQERIGGDTRYFQVPEDTGGLPIEKVVVAILTCLRATAELLVVVRKFLEAPEGIAGRRRSRACGCRVSCV